MKITLYAMALATALSTVAFAADFSGKLVDATCSEQNQKMQAPQAAEPQAQQPQSKATSCDATAATTSFGIDVAGKMYKLDAAGNSKAATALRDRADRAADPAKAGSSSYTAKVTGTEKGGTIAVESIEVQ